MALARPNGPSPPQALADIYDSYTEGFGTPDLIAAKKLLEEICIA